MVPMIIPTVWTINITEWPILTLFPDQVFLFPLDTTASLPYGPALITELGAA